MPKVSATVCPWARLAKVPLRKPIPGFLTTINCVPMGGAKLRVKLTVSPAAMLEAVTGTSVAELYVAGTTAARSAAVTNPRPARNNTRRRAGAVIIGSLFVEKHGVAKEIGKDGHN